MLPETCSFVYRQPLRLPEDGHPGLGFAASVAGRAGGRAWSLHRPPLGQPRSLMWRRTARSFPRDTTKTHHQLV